MPAGGRRKPLVAAVGSTLLAVLLGSGQAGAVDVDPAVLEAEAQRIAVMDRVKDTVLAIFPPSGRGGGSGVVISPDGYALTNFHVVKPCGHAMKCGMADGRIYDAVIVGVDPTGDIALIKLFGRDDFPCAELGDSDQVAVGDWCFAMGNPFLLATDLQPTVTYGIISGVHRYQYPAGSILEYADCLQTDASINPGNSGGPLFDAEGRLIGINGRGSFEKRGRVNVGVAYAVSINQIKNFLGYLHSGRIVDHATLGATVYTTEDGRVVVDQVLETSDAWRRGLRYGDEIIRFGGRPITTANAFKNVLGIYPKGWRVPLSFRHEGQRYDVMVRLAGVHTPEELIRAVSGRPRRLPMPIPVPEPQPEQPKPEQPQPHQPQPGSPQPEQPNSDQPRPEQSPPDEPRPDAPPPEEPQPDSPRPPAPRSSDEKPKARQPKDVQPNGSPPKEPHPGGPPPGRPRPTPGPNPIPIPGGPFQIGRPAPPVPEIVRRHYEEKRGYANYYFNRLHRGRVWKAWMSRSHLDEHSGVWNLAGRLPSGSEFQLEISGQGVLLTLPSVQWKWEPGEELAGSLDPPQSGGLLLSLYLWRRLAVEGPERFGDVYYLGTAPLVGHEGLMDVLVAVDRGVECRLYFDPREGHLLCLEMFPADDVDPCELYFYDYHEQEGRFLPARLEVHTGGELFAQFAFEQWMFAAGEPAAEKSAGQSAAGDQPGAAADRPSAPLDQGDSDRGAAPSDRPPEAAQPIPARDNPTP